MSAIAQRRTAAAAAIMMLFAVLQYLLFAVNPEPAGAAGPEPTYESAVVDGDIGEWDLGADYFAEMHQAGDPEKPLLGKAYLRYDCDTSNLYVLALSEDGFDGLGEAWAKIYELGNSEANTTEVAIPGDNGRDRGFETVVPNLAPGDYTIEIHFNDRGETASNARGGGELTIRCPDEELEKVGVTVKGECLVDDKGDSYGEVSIVIDPEPGATVLFESVEYTVSTAGIQVAAPGSYPWSAEAEPGFELDEPSQGPVEIEDCSDGDEDEPLTVAVSGTCVTEEDGSATGRLNVTINPDGGATVTVDGKDYSTTTTGIVVAADSTYGWTAVAADDNEIDGDSSGSVLIEACSDDDDNGGSTPTRSSRSDDVESALGDFVWFDENQNGRQDGGDFEFPVPGATVELLAPDGTVLETQVTGDDGLYLFDELDAGNYRVRVCVAGAEFTDTNKLGVSDNVDSDVFEANPKDGCGTTALITLGEGVTDLTWDAGIVLEVLGIQIEPTTTTAPTTTTIEPVTVETLPFTGLELEDMVVLSIGVLAAGSALLLVAGRRNDESESETVVSGWSNN